MIDVEEVKLRSLANVPFEFNNLTIANKSIREIVKDGFLNFNYHLRFVTLKKTQVFPPETLEKIESVSLIDALYEANAYDLMDDYLDSFQYFLNSEISVEPDKVIIVGNTRISFDDITELSEIIGIQNCISTEEEEIPNPLNNRVKELKERMRKQREKAARLKSESKTTGDRLDFSDLISILSSQGNGISIHNIFDLNYYQFNDQFNRMKMVKDYEININALMHQMLDPKKTKIEHWMTKMTK